MKQLELFSDKKLIDIALEALSVDDESVFVVLGAQSKQVETEIEAHILYNPIYQQGMGTSIAHLVKHIIKEDYDALLIHLCDLPLVTQKDIKNLIEEYKKQPRQPLACSFEDSIAPPCIVPKDLFKELAQLSEDQGAKSILLKNKVRTFDLPESHLDIDTPEDLKKLMSHRLQ